MVEPLWNCQVSIPYSQIQNHGQDYIQYVVEKLKQDAAVEVFRTIYDQNHPIVVETHIETWDDPSRSSRVYKLHYRLTAVQTRNVVMPVFTFVNHNGQEEWKCPACSTINIMDATFCGEKHYNAVGCGRPRDKVRQNMQSMWTGAIL